MAVPIPQNKNVFQLIRSQYEHTVPPTYSNRTKRRISIALYVAAFLNLCAAVASFYVLKNSPFWGTRLLKILTGSALILGIVANRVLASQKRHYFMYICGQLSRDLFIDTKLRISPTSEALLTPHIQEDDVFIRESGEVIVYSSAGKTIVFTIQPEEETTQQNRKTMQMLTERILTRELITRYNQGIRPGLNLKIAIADDGTLPPEQLYLRQWHS